MGAAIQRLDFVLSSVLRVAFYRTLHVVSVPLRIDEVLAYVREQEQGEGRFFGRLETVREGFAFGVYRWLGVQLGNGLLFDLWIFGFRHGPQTIFLRTGFYRLNFTPQGVRETAARIAAQVQGQN